MLMHGGDGGLHRKQGHRGGGWLRGGLEYDGDERLRCRRHHRCAGWLRGGLLNARSGPHFCARQHGGSCPGHLFVYTC